MKKTKGSVDDHEVDAKGHLHLAIRAHVSTQLVAVALGPRTWVEIPPELARDIAAALVREADRAEGKTA